MEAALTTADDLARLQASFPLAAAGLGDDPAGEFILSDNQCDIRFHPGCDKK